MPCQWHRLELREGGRIVERHRIAREQQVDALIQRIPRVARRNHKPDWSQIVARQRESRGGGSARRCTFRRDPAGACSERPTRVGNELRDRQIRCARADGTSARRLCSVIERLRSSIGTIDWTRRPTSCRNSLPVAPCAKLARTSAEVTGVPSEKSACSRSVTIQVRPSVSSRQDDARPGATRPMQSTRISVSYS